MKHSRILNFNDYIPENGKLAERYFQDICNGGNRLSIVKNKNQGKKLSNILNKI